MVIELEPFTRVYIKYPYNERKIRHMLNRVANLMSQVEYETVKRGLRKCNVYHVYPERFDELIEKVQMDKLVWLPILRSKVYRGFSHKHFPVQELKPGTFVYGVIARTLEDALLFKKAHEGVTDHRTIGRLLGYPECDIDFFCRVWGKGTYDPVFEVALNTDTARKIDENTVEVTGEPLLNQLARYASLRLTSWFPCSYTCKAALEVGKKWFKIAKEIDDEAADWAYEQLSQPMTWNLLYGVVEVDTPIMKILAASYFTEKPKIIKWKT